MLAVTISLFSKVSFSAAPSKNASIANNILDRKMETFILLKLYIFSFFNMCLPISMYWKSYLLFLPKFLTHVTLSGTSIYAWQSEKNITKEHRKMLNIRCMQWNKCTSSNKIYIFLSIYFENRCKSTKI